MIARPRLTLRRSVVAAVLTCAGLAVLAPGASAHPAPKVTICHATGSATNPYVQITVSANALGAHSSHHNGADVIPAPPTGCKHRPLPEHRGGPAGRPRGARHRRHGDCVAPASRRSSISERTSRTMGPRSRSNASSTRTNTWRRTPPTIRRISEHPKSDEAKVPAGIVVDENSDCVAHLPWLKCVVGLGVMQTATTVTGTTGNDTIDCTGASPGKTITGVRATTRSRARRSTTRSTAVTATTPSRVSAAST